MESIGKKLCELRKSNGLSQEELAEKLGVSRQTISNWENDKVRIDTVSATEICRLFSVSMDELFLESASKKKPPKQGSKIALYLCLAFSAIATAVALAGIFVFKNDAVSSTIVFTEKAWLIVLATVGLIVCGIILYLIIRNSIKK